MGFFNKIDSSMIANAVEQSIICVLMSINHKIRMSAGRHQIIMQSQ